MIYLYIFLSSFVGACSTFYLVHKKHFSTVRASSLSTIVFVFLTMFLNVDFVSRIQAAFFGATFIGMTSSNRFAYSGLFLASILFVCVYVLILPMFVGIGGGLGAAAFVASSFFYFCKKNFFSFL